MNTYQRTTLLSTLSGTVLALCVNIAAADVISFTLDQGNTAISGFTGPYVQVDVNRTSTTTATISFTSLTNSGDLYRMGDGGTAGVNINATSFTLGTISGTSADLVNFTPGTYSDGGAGNLDGAGQFNLTVDTFDGYTHSSDFVSFLVTDVSGTWASASDVLAANGNGFVAASHIFVELLSDPTAGALATGFAAGSGGGGGGNFTPEPGTLVLLGAALMGGGLLRRRRS